MNCVIIEDGQRATKHLENQIALTGYDIHILQRLDSVESAVNWLRQHTADLIFLDVQLGDGLCFEIFDHIDITTPVIFTTSYDQYIVRAFEVHSIAYLLKPIKVSDLKQALDKYSKVYKERPVSHENINLLKLDYQKRFLVQKGHIVKSISVDDVAYLYIQNKGLLILISKKNEQYLVENTLDKLEQRLDPSLFFRINRQYIINIDAIDTIIPYDHIRMKIGTNPPCKEELIVSTKRIRSFKEWLNH